MNISLFVDKYISDINELNEINIKKYDYKIKEKLKQKEVIEIKSSKEMKDFSDSRKKYFDKQSKIDEDINIFQNNIIQTDETNKNFYDLNYEEKIEHINDYIKRKKIKLSCDLNIIDNILNDNTLLKKYITIDKTYNMINKISFFKKMENGEHTIILEKNKTIKKNFFK
jgi:hypothetical protein